MATCTRLSSTLAVVSCPTHQIRRLHVPVDVGFSAFTGLVAQTLGVADAIVIKCGTFYCTSDADFTVLLEEVNAASPPLLRVTIELGASVRRCFPLRPSLPSGGKSVRCFVYSFRIHQMWCYLPLESLHAALLAVGVDHRLTNSRKPPHGSAATNPSPRMPPLPQR